LPRWAIGAPPQRSLVEVSERCAAPPGIDRGPFTPAHERDSEMPQRTALEVPEHEFEDEDWDTEEDDWDADEHDVDLDEDGLDIEEDDEEY
jgi:hypothetical protein